MYQKELIFMPHRTAKSENKKPLEKCPDCGIGYMIHIMENRYQCSECNVEATMDDYSLFWFDDFNEYDFYEDDIQYISVYDAALKMTSNT